MSCSYTFPIHLFTRFRESVILLSLIYLCYFNCFWVIVFQNGILNAAPYLSFFFCSIAAGPIVDFVLRRRWLSVTATRKTVTLTGL